MRIKRLRILTAVVLGFGITVTAFAGGYEIPWFTIDGGGAMLSTGGGFELSGTFGQFDACPTLSGGGFELNGGFWTGIDDSGPAIPGDCDGDGDVDLDDFAGIESCLFGPGGGLASGCECFDFDEDNDVDLNDFSGFQQAFEM